ncbi:MAG: helix-turn-helix transcriptional regulator [Planctomycetes bacterium]|nr:helix-turn-helix transcriptional regulator [Planctomycetota bacterium]
MKKILRENGLAGRTVVQRMAADLKLHRHTIGKLYRNQASNPSLDVLGRICDWLERNGVPGGILPQALFGVRPSSLWEAVAAPGAVTLYVGEYRQMPPGPRPLRWIAQHDALAIAKIVQSLSGTATVAERRVSVGIEHVPFRFDPEKSAVGADHLQEDRKRAGEIFRKLQASARATSAIILGSQRANHLVELLVADIFGCEAFTLPRRGRRAAPLYLAFRKEDRVVPSCFGGRTAPPGCTAVRGPGIYYRTRDGWSVCPWTRGVQDAGVILVSRDPGTAALRMAVFGFSGPGTEAVAEELLRVPDRFWPLPVARNGKEVGVHICRFGLCRDTSESRDEEVRVKDIEVIPLDKEILAECLE